MPPHRHVLTVEEIVNGLHVEYIERARRFGVFVPNAAPMLAVIGAREMYPIAERLLGRPDPAYAKRICDALWGPGRPAPIWFRSPVGLACSRSLAVQSGWIFTKREVGVVFGGVTDIAVDVWTMRAKRQGIDPYAGWGRFASEPVLERLVVSAPIPEPMRYVDMDHVDYDPDDGRRKCPGCGRWMVFLPEQVRCTDCRRSTKAVRRGTRRDSRHWEM